MSTQFMRLLLIAIVFIAMVIAVPLRGLHSQTASDAPVLLIDIKGAIGFVTAAYFAKALERAASQGSPVVLARLDTPGGLLKSTREMIHAILASRVPVVMYVAPGGSRAASAGTYLLYASHIAAMAPGTHLGAATPIALSAPGLPSSPPPSKSEKQSGSEPASTAERKSINDAVADIRALAEIRGRNADWGEKAVREAATLTATAALKENVIDLIASDVNELMSSIDGRSIKTTSGEVQLATKGRPVVEIKPDWKLDVMTAITDPNIALILLMIGIYGIIFEFLTPGAIAPGVVGGVCLIVALTALSVLPVNLGGLALLLLGVALMVVEAFAPSVVIGLGGLIAFVLGALFLFDPGDTNVQVRVSWQVLVAMAALSAAFLTGVLGLAMRARRRPVRTGPEDLIGSTGKVVDWAQDRGHILVLGETWAAQSGHDLARGQQVRVVGRSGLTLEVEQST
ncbi:MAG TPA: nodulation protein NfeD [Hyphomicrobiaceae bacterium]|nr:nodulation protein NfeD [Hyphomicrobiaceae bacterium]